MCGIAAVMGAKAKGHQLTEMLTTLAHRGEPNHFNESLSLSNCNLGMNRLAIVDRDNAIQPMSTADRRYHIVFNGEIYNAAVLRSELEKSGRQFKTLSDTEVILQGFAEWGPKVVERLEGMFAFFINDCEKNDFFIARDQFGIKPLYFSQSDNNFYFGSEIKALASLDEVEEISVLEPGTYQTKDGSNKYAPLPLDYRQGVLDKAVLIEELRERFDLAVKSQVQTDLPIGVFMSGGLDSSAVLATACLYHSNVTAIIIGNDQSEDRLIAEKFCREREIPYVIEEAPSEEELAKLIPDLIRICETFEPNVIRQAALSLLVSRRAAGLGLKVLLCGEGADELFAGYPELDGNSESLHAALLTFLGDLHRTQLQRVDRTSMSATVEVRVPFLDRSFAKFALTIPPEMKRVAGRGGEKWILREAMRDRLPDYICRRPKAVFSEGAGLGGNDDNGMFAAIVERLIDDDTFYALKDKYKEWNLRTKEEAFYFNYFVQHRYEKAKFTRNRVVANRRSTSPRHTNRDQSSESIQHLEF